MKINIKSLFSIPAIFSAVILWTTGCDDYVRTGVTPYIYVNHLSLKLFTGETFQLKASPSETSYEWTSEDIDVATVSTTGLLTATGAGVTNIVVKSGDIHTKVPVTVVNKIPITGLRVDIDYVELTPGVKVNITATRIPENANDISFLIWTTGNVDVATVNAVGDITAIGEGETEIICTGGDFSQKIMVSVAYTRPFKGPHILSSEAPYILPMVNFDLGGEGYAFHDNDTGNSGNLQYRADNGDNASGNVDMENASLPNIGWTGDGEWLQYTLEVKTQGKYQVEVEEASPNSDGSFRIEVNGIDQTGTVIASNTGGWANFVWDVVPAKLTLNEGINKIKYYFVHGAHNIRTLRFTYVP
ncbi:MAG: Ig-like domain-containing protein [Tannerella sp.]|jgi:hypothetical protein|nr:Ig-like domain-containing protein [Tannerella sp.]